MKKQRRRRRISRLIKMTPEYMDECRAEFEKALSLAKLSDGKLNYTKVFSGGDKKAVVYFTATAWAKMVLLIKEFDKGSHPQPRPSCGRRRAMRPPCQTH